MFLMFVSYDSLVNKLKVQKTLVLEIGLLLETSLCSELLQKYLLMTIVESNFKHVHAQNRKCILETFISISFALIGR